VVSGELSRLSHFFYVCHHVVRRVREIAKSYYWLRHVGPLYEDPSIRPYGITRPPMDVFSWNAIFGIFRKLVHKIKIHYNPTRIMGTFIWSPIYIFDHISLKFLLQWEMFQTRITEKLKTHISYSITSFRKNVPFKRKCGNTFYSRTGHTWQYDTPIACWIPKATDTRPEYVIMILDFPSQQWLDERVSTLRYTRTYIVSRVLDTIMSAINSRQHNQRPIFNLATCSDLWGLSSGHQHKIHKRKYLQRLK
jgi:hypothetical protein